MDLQEIQNLIKFVSKAGVTEVEIEKKDFKITIKSDGPKSKNKQIVEAVLPQAAMPTAIPIAHMPAPIAPPPVAAPAPLAAAPPAPAAEENSAYIEIKSPMIGTFYRSPSPDKPLFVEVGDTIKEGATVCIVEAMKLFNEIDSEVSGKIVKVLVDDNSPVEFDQPLFLVDPS